MSKITVIGTGYVGLVTGAILADFGHNIICVDIDKNKIDRLNMGEIPIYEPELESYVRRNSQYGRLSFTTDTVMAVKQSDIVFIAVGTPPADDGSADMQYVYSAIKDIVEGMNDYKIIVNKSTVPVGTGRKVTEFIREELTRAGKSDVSFDVVSNPEFLREGSAVHDCLHPDRVVIGSGSEKAIELIKDVYKVLYINQTPFVTTNLETAELIKYASNAFLALKITYINEIANLCEAVGANVQQVAYAMGKDGRISPRFLHPGPGYGGSCFPKDTEALVHLAQEKGQPVSLIEATIEANEKQKQRMANKVINAMGDLRGKTIAVLGITFKPNTDDMRASSSLVIVPMLIEAGAKIRIFDPQGEKEGVWRFERFLDSITFCQDEYDAVKDCDAVALITEWNQFRSLDMKKLLDNLKGRYFFDFRNLYNRNEMESIGFDYHAVGM